jgi:gamma-glutamylcyclotransferase (GGCT)/AIG2-like uncharacterized protein YtfP
MDKYALRPVFVYGTLKSKERLHNFLAKQSYLGKATTVDSNFLLKEFARSFPIAFRNNASECKYRVKGEVYDIQDEEQYENVRLLEENAGYKRVKTLVDFGNGIPEIAEIYIMEESDINFNNPALTNHSITVEGNVQEWGRGNEVV